MFKITKSKFNILSSLLQILDSKFKINFFYLDLFKIPNSRFQILLILCALFFANNTHAGTIIKSPAYLGLQRGLVGCWSFDGSYTKVPDCSGNNNTGTLTNGPIRAAGKIGQALDFDGVDDYVSISDSAVFTLNAANKYTWTAWIKPDTFPGWATIWSQTLDSSTYLYFYAHTATEGSLPGGSITRGVSVWWVSTAGQILVTEVDNSLTTGTWYHIAIRYDGSVAQASRFKIYINGADSTGGTTSAGTIADINPTNIRTGANEPFGEYFDGLIDEVRIYNRALSANEIARLYRIGLGSTANRTSTSLDKGLVGHWTFDGADIGSSGTIAKDRSGNNNNGTLTNGPTRIEGKIGQALSFDGVDDYVEIPNSTVFNTSNGTWSAWINIKNLPGTGENDPIISRHDSGSSFNGLTLRINGDVFAGQFKNGSGEVADVESTTVVSAGRWYHLAIVFSQANGGADSIWVNGIKEASGTNSAAWAFNGQVVRFADAIDTFWNIFDGLIDDVRIYNRALSASEINRLYQQAQSKYNASKTDSLTKGLVGYWTFDGADIGSSGTIAKDRSGNNNNGTLTNGPTRIEGKIGQALNFDGVDDFVNIGSNANLQLTGAMTICAWFKADTIDTVNEDYIVARSTADPLGPYALYLFSGSSLGFGWRDDVGALEVYETAGGVIQTGIWTHVCAARNSALNDVDIYINTVNTAVTPTGNVAVTTTSSNTTIGRLGDYVAGNVSFDGLIDDVRVYNRALSASEIMKLYNMGR